MNWRWIFYVNIPVGAMAAFLAYTYVRETPKEAKGKPIDWWGIALLAVAVGSLQTILEKGESEDWFATPYITILTISAILGLILFIWREMSIDYPIVNFAILRHRSFAVGMFTSFVLGFGLYGSVFVFPVFCQNLLGFDAQQTGEILFPGGLCTIVMMPFIGKMLNKGIPAQFMATAGMFLFFVFTTMLSNSTLAMGTHNFFLPLMIRGVGMALLFVPLTTLAIADLKGPEVGQGTGLNNMMRQLGGSFGIATLTTVIHIRQGVHRNNLLTNITATNPALIDRVNNSIHAFMAKGHSLIDATRMAYGAIEGALTKQVLLLTYDDAYWISGLVMLFSIPLLYLQPFKKSNAKMPVDAH
jgi:DHA2 family multidrug resistance protein